ncbi:MAG: BON domain-containing protein [Deltaproteobacteria bacterium]|nr:MAG: BON domain-containing protein [Deltaproteobacteria bacterium]
MRKLIAVLGLVVLCVGGYYVVQKYSKSIPEKLERSSLEALRRANIVGITVEMDGLDATLSGAVPTADQRQAAVAAVAAVAGVRTVDGERLTVQAPDRGPGEPGTAEVGVELAASWEDGALDISGEVLGLVVEKRIIQKIDQVFDGAMVTNTIRTRAGTPPKEEDVATRVVVALEALARTSRGTLRVTDAGVTLNGTVADDATREQMTALLKGKVLPPAELALSLVVAPPVVATEDVVVADEDVAAAATGDAEEADAAGGDEDAVAAASDVEALADAGEADTAEQDTVAADTVALDTTAPELDTTTPEADTTAPEADTTAPEADTAVVAADTASEDVGPPIPHGVDLSAATPLSEEQCNDVLWWLVEGEKHIQFKGRKILPESDARLVQVVAVLKRCPEGKIDVEGYTNAYGEPDALKKLSWAWASIVKNRLVELGIPKERLGVRAFGYNRARYPDRRATRHLNDRVEFKVKGVK